MRRTSLTLQLIQVKQVPDDAAYAQRIGPATFGPVAMTGGDGFDLVEKAGRVIWNG